MKTELWLLLLLLPFLYIACEQDHNSNKRHGDISIAQRIEQEKCDDPEIENAIDQLLGQMTLAEKVGQMVQITPNGFFLTEYDPDNTNLVPFSETHAIDTTILGNLFREYQVGSIMQGVYAAPDEWCRYISIFQEFNMRYNRNGIPMIFGIDLIHGANNIKGGTIFPHNLNLGATFNKDLNYAAAEITALESVRLGMHWVFNPELDVGQNIYWGRVFETYGEDPYLCATMGSIYTKALQENEKTLPYKQAGCARHYMGYSDPNTGRDRTPAAIGYQKLHEYYKRPFRAAIDSGLMSVMVCSGEVNGVPVHMSKRILTDILRDDMGFRGIALSDMGDVGRLVKTHRAVPDAKEAAYHAVMAGLDVYMAGNSRTSFCDHVIALVREGRIPEERIDLSVRRMLRMKYKLGLFDHPIPPCDDYSAIGRESHRKKALQAARESIVLMKNHQAVLPLQDPRAIALAGPFTDLRHPLCGAWTIDWQGDNESMYPRDMLTVYQAMEQTFGRTRVRRASINNLHVNARNAGAIILTIGEYAYTEWVADVPDNTLAEDQQELIRAALSTGKPVVLVVISGRPKVIPPDLYDQCDAVLFAGLPGKEGAQAIADIVSGKVNPSGKLPFSYPYHAAYYLPYNHKYAYDALKPGTEMKSCLMEFGTGLSYTGFEYAGLSLSDSVINRNSSLAASVRVENIGTRSGKEAVLWYITDEFGLITRPVKMLRHFEKSEFSPGESRTFSFTIDPIRDLSYPDEYGNPVLEPGRFTVSVGTLEASFRLNSVHMPGAQQ